MGGAVPKWLVFFVAIFTLGCGARSELDPGFSSDAGTDGATSRDSGVDTRPPVRDSGRDVPSLPDAPSGVACASDRDCTGVRCAADRDRVGEDLAVLPLICDPGLSDRAPVTDGDFCQAAAECSRGLCLVGGTCVAPCAIDMDCGPGQRCTEVFGRTGAEALQPFDGCVNRVDAWPSTFVTERPEVPIPRGESSVGLEVEADSSLAFHVFNPGNDSTVITRLVHEDAEVLFSVFAITEDAPAPINPVNFQGSVLTVALPSGSTPIAAGAVTVEFQAEERSEAEFTTIMPREPGTTLDLDIFYVGGGRLRPEGDRGPIQVQNALRELASIYSAPGIRIGDVRQHDVVGGLRERFAIIEEDREGRSPDLLALRKLSAGIGVASVPVFLVRSMDRALGTAGGIPGPPGMNGTESSGVVIAVDLHDEPAPIELSVGRTMAHEIGHYLGLFHTSELMGFVLEPLADTPECRIDRDSDGDGVLFPSECMGAGSTNVMFWAPDGAELTPQQGDVMRRNPLTR